MVAPLSRSLSLPVLYRRPLPGLATPLRTAHCSHGKALVIYGAVHFYRTMPRDLISSMGDDIGIARNLEIDFPGRTFVVIPVGRLDPPRGVTADIDPDFQEFDRALKTQARPVLVSLQRSPFRDFTAEEFLGRTLTTCRGAGGCVSVFQASSLTLGQMADACVYVGAGADVDSKASGSILFRNVKIEPAEKGGILNSRPTWP